MRFTDRSDAGRQLGARLREMGPERPVVYALPRGGVPVAIEIAKALKAPLDLLLVRKIGAPGAPELAIGAVAEGATPGTVRNPEIMAHAGADDAFFARAMQRELAEMERRRTLYLGGRARLSPAGRTAIVVDDGLATGATAKAALDALRRQGAAKTVLAVPVAPVDTLAEMAAHADQIVCLYPARRFHGVGSFYDDFHQLTDEETIGLLREAWVEEAQPADPEAGLIHREVAIPPHRLGADLCLPPDARGIVVFAHGSGSSRFSPRNVAVARRLNMLGFATLLLDLLTPDEARERRNVFDIPLLAKRLVEANAWILSEPELAELPLGLFGASTGAGAALLAAAELHERVAAVVSRGGRPDLAGARLAEVRAPTLFIVGGEDHQVLALNRKALASLTCEKLLRIVPGATHVFEEPGALEQVTEMAGEWFQHYLVPRPRPRIAATAAAPVDALRAAAEPLPDIDDPNFAAAIDRFADCRLVLLGEASHGTSEFYRARAAFTRRLAERHGFSIIAVEADWPDAATIDRYIRHAPNRAHHGPAPFTRFPTWMWRNTDMHDFITDLRALNAARQTEARVGFYGLDLYNMTAAMAAVLAYLDRVDPETARVARARYACLSPWSREPAAYGREAISRGYALCEEPVTRMLLDLLQRERRYAVQDGAAFLDAAQNARLIADAERYYRVMYYGSQESWNLRDNHMFDTLCHVLDWAGPQRKAVVWAHNSHIGDARFTEMGERGELNLGQLCRQRFGAQAALIGFGTHTGTVAAASEWDAPMEIKTVRPSRPDSYEAWCHATGHARFLLDLRDGKRETLRPALAGPRLERYIGVIYRPETERWSHYAASELLDQYDAFVWFDQTRAVTPLPARVVAGEDESYPFGL
jgi:erythromycin esterase-like protein/predicted phosphoribosyltransferase/predicted alpha/beta-hydrolase family hydrolase